MGPSFYWRGVWGEGRGTPVEVPTGIQLATESMNMLVVSYSTILKTTNRNPKVMKASKNGSNSDLETTQTRFSEEWKLMNTILFILL